MSNTIPLPLEPVVWFRAVGNPNEGAKKLIGFGEICYARGCNIGATMSATKVLSLCKDNSAIKGESQAIGIDDSTPNGFCVLVQLSEV